MKSKLTIIIPGIRPQNWPAIYEQIKESIGEYTFEVIAVGPRLPVGGFFEDKLNFRFIRDFGHPSRCLQLASEFAEGEYLCWLPDDIILEKNALGESLRKMIIATPEYGRGYTGMALLYSEGTDFTGNQPEDNSYWIARTHQDQQVKQVKEGWRIAPVFMYPTATFKELGGLDCQFEHINFNTHDLAYRIQHLGGTIWPSPVKVFSADWKPNDPVIGGAHYQNDLPLFNSLYNSDTFPRIEIRLDNWRNTESFWWRRYGRS